MGDMFGGAIETIGEAAREILERLDRLVTLAESRESEMEALTDAVRDVSDRLSEIESHARDQSDYMVRILTKMQEKL